MLKKPFLVHESTSRHVPLHLFLMAKRMALEATKHTINPRHAVLLALLHVLMLEEGFTPLDVPCRGVDVEGHEFSRSRILKYVDFSVKQTIKNQESGLFRVPYSLLPFDDVICHLIVCFSEHGSNQTLALINLKATGIQIRTFCIDINNHIRISSVTGDIDFLGMREFSKNFKDLVSGPLREEILCKQELKTRSTSRLVNLPEDVCGLVLRHLRPIDIGRLAVTCKDMQARCEDSTLWHELYERDFKNWVDPEGNRIPRDLINWRIEYRERLAEDREIEAQIANRDWKRRLAVLWPSTQ